MNFAEETLIITIWKKKCKTESRRTSRPSVCRAMHRSRRSEVGLYLEQVVRYINARLAPLGEPELTGSMVSNYVKQKLVPAPQKKLYTAEHLARLLFIAVVKPVVPLEGLRLMFSIQEECYPLQTAYDYFCDEFENMLGAAFGVAPAVEGLGETESDAKDLLRSTISATVNKVCLDRYLEEYRKRREQAETIAEKENI